MSVIPAKTLREKTSQELLDQLALEKKRQFDAVVKGASGESIKPHERRSGRRLIARIQTILRERIRRGELDARLRDLAPKAERASAEVVKLAREVDARLAHIKSELAKPEGTRKPGQMPSRVRIRHVGYVGADRAAAQLAETKRLRASLEREDMGQGK